MGFSITLGQWPLTVLPLPGLRRSGGVRFLPSKEECDVKRGAVQIDKLKKKHFQGEAVLPFGLCARLFCGKMGSRVWEAESDPSQIPVSLSLRRRCQFAYRWQVMEQTIHETDPQTHRPAPVRVWWEVATDISEGIECPECSTVTGCLESVEEGQAEWMGTHPQTWLSAVALLFPLCFYLQGGAYVGSGGLLALWSPLLLHILEYRVFDSDVFTLIHQFPFSQENTMMISFLELFLYISTLCLIIFRPQSGTNSHLLIFQLSQNKGFLDTLMWIKI